MRKVLFLDVDGVMNSKDTLQRSTRGVIGVDPYLSILVDRIVQATGCDVVLSSSWRNMGKGYDEIDSIIPLIGKTGVADCRNRGCEIREWIIENIPYDGRHDPAVFRYAILDDDNDMLVSQLDSFFQTTFDTGLTEEIVEKVIAHLNG